jgi:hypothetical protein
VRYPTTKREFEMKKDYLLTFDFNGHHENEYDSLGQVMREVLHLIDNGANHIKVYRKILIDGSYYSLIFIQS